MRRCEIRRFCIGNQDKGQESGLLTGCCGASWRKVDKVSAEANRASITYVENISGPACSRYRIDRFFHCPDGFVSGVIRFHHACP